MISRLLFVSLLKLNNACYQMRLSKEIYCLLSILLLLQLTSCSKTIVGIGPFDGLWFMTAYSPSDHYSGGTQLDLMVEGLSLSGEGDLMIIEGYGPQVMPPDWHPNDNKYRLTISGEVHPNGAIEGRARIVAVDTSNVGNNGSGPLTGGLNPVSGNGSGTMRLGDFRFNWTATYSER